MVTCRISMKLLEKQQNTFLLKIRNTQILLGKRWLECVTTDPPLFWGKPQSWETIKKRLPEVNPLKKDVLVEMYGSLSQVKFRWLTPVTN